MPEIGDILARTRDGGYRRVKTVDLFDPALIDRHAQLEEELQRTIDEDGRRNRTPQAPVVAQQIEDLLTEIEETAMSFRFGALSHVEWTNLLAAHPPTKKQMQEHAKLATDWRGRTSLELNPDTFPQALIAACAIDPAMTAEQAEELANSLGPAQFEVLWQACVEINKSGTVAPKSLAAGAILRLSEQSGNTAAHEESPAASS